MIHGTLALGFCECRGGDSEPMDREHSMTAMPADWKSIGWPHCSEVMIAVAGGPQQAIIQSTNNLLLGC